MTLPEPGLEPEEFIGRAVALRPKLIAEQAATELGDRLSRDALLEALRTAGLSVGGKRRKAVYDAVLAERDRAA